MGEITLELHLDFQIPESGLAINGLIGGLKEAAGQIHGEILVSLMQALEERLIETMIQNEPERYQRNGLLKQASFFEELFRDDSGLRPIDWRENLRI